MRRDFCGTTADKKCPYVFSLNTHQPNKKKHDFDNSQNESEKIRQNVPR